MLEFLTILPLAQVVTAAPSPVVIPHLSEVLQPNEIRPLPGQLDAVPVFNSNSPELIQSEGILLSTFPPEGMGTPSAHLNFPFQGRFDLFAHHISRGVTVNDVRTLYVGVLIFNPNDRPVRLDILQAASYLSQEAPFNDLPSYVANPLGTVFAGPGSRTTNDVLRGRRQSSWPSEFVIAPRSPYLFINAPIPLRSMDALRNGVPLPQFLTSNALGNASSASLGNLLPQRLTPAINGRTLLAYLWSSEPVYVASLAMYAPLNPNGSERAPLMSEWIQLLLQGRLAGPRDIPPTPPDRNYVSRFFYGRVSGVAQGSQWTAQLTDTPNANYLSVPPTGQAVSYVLSTIDNGTFGTGQIQSAPLLARYADTAYRAHGNYGVHYNLTLPLQNNTDRAQTVAILLQTPLKEGQTEEGLRFLQPPPDQVFFRGTVRIRYSDDFGVTETRYLHIIQRRGQEGEPLIRLRMPRGDRRLVQVDFIYPPDSTPPQVLTVQTVQTIDSQAQY